MNHTHFALVVDDQICTISWVHAVLRSLGHDYHHAETQAQAEELLAKNRYCYVLLDLEFPADEDCVARVETGFNLLANLRTQFGREELPVIVLTAHEKGSEYQVRALQLNANDFASKVGERNHEPLDVKIRRVLEQSCPLPKRATSSRPKQAQRTLHFDGSCKRRRYRMEIDGKEAYVRLTTFTILWKLAHAAAGGEDGWCLGRDLNPGNVHNALSRLRTDLADQVGILDSLVEGDGHGAFRLTDGISVSQDSQRLRAIPIGPSGLDFVSGPDRAGQGATRSGAQIAAQGSGARGS
ncbi:MAG: response regulator [Myxococcales bacterium]|nr:response regulator [Myxococcales bacterium]